MNHSSEHCHSRRCSSTRKDTIMDRLSPDVNHRWRAAIEAVDGVADAEQALLQELAKLNEGGA